MPSKPDRKRQRTSAATSAPAPPIPLGARRDNEAAKDDEERALEAALFGKPFVPRKGKAAASAAAEDEEDGYDAMEGVEDDQLFFVDAPTAGILDGEAPSYLPQETPSASGSYDEGEDDEGEDDEGEDEDDQNAPPPGIDFKVDYEASSASSSASSDSDASSSDSESDDDHEPHPVPVPAPSFPLTSSKKRTSVWHDPSDAQIAVSLQDDKRLRKLRREAAEDVIDGRDYEMRLREKYEAINPAPAWASALRAKRKKAPRATSSDEEDVEDEDLFTTAGVSLSVRRSKLKQGELAVERQRDANHAAPSKAPISAVEFHSRVAGVMLVAQADRRLRLFNVDGATNPLLQQVHIPDLPLSTATFHPHHPSVLLTGPRPFYYTYDLQSGNVSRSIWTRGRASSSSTSAEGLGMELARFSPDGASLAVAGRRGHVHLVEWGRGGGEAVGSVKMNKPVRGMCWAREGKELVTVAEDAEVYLWDVGMRRCIRRWTDDGGFGPTAIESSRSDGWTAVGSKSGIVNVYDSPSLLSPRPTPRKSLGNLTTTISSLRFDPTSQMLALASKDKKDQLRVVHLPSLTTFSNWPTPGTPLGKVTSLDFSSASEWLAVGNAKGAVRLYALKHFRDRAAAAAV